MTLLRATSARRDAHRAREPRRAAESRPPDPSPGSATGSHSRRGGGVGKRNRHREREPAGRRESFERVTEAAPRPGRRAPDVRGNAQEVQRSAHASENQRRVQGDAAADRPRSGRCRAEGRADPAGHGGVRRIAGENQNAPKGAGGRAKKSPLHGGRSGVGRVSPSCRAGKSERTTGGSLPVDRPRPTRSIPKSGRSEKRRGDGGGQRRALPGLPREAGGPK